MSEDCVTADPLTDGRLTADPVAAGLLFDILKDPADDAPRLILADWLDDHDQPERAEFIRLSVERHHRQVRGCVACEQVSQGHGGRVALSCWRCLACEVRLAVLAGGTDGDLRLWSWFGKAVNDNRIQPGWQRGFVHTVRCPLAAWEEHGPAIVSRHPVERVEATDDIYAESDVTTGTYTTSTHNVCPSFHLWLASRVLRKQRQWTYPTLDALKNDVSKELLLWAWRGVLAHHRRSLPDDWLTALSEEKLRAD